MTTWRKLSSRVFAGALLSFAALASPGCVIVTHDTGTATLRWSVEERYAARDCDFHHASTVQISVYEMNGSFTSQVYASCASFYTTVTLHEGWYTAHLTMLDANHRAVSTTATIPAFRVYIDEDTLVEADFPANSFY